MPTIRFSKNWNNKLDNEYFSTIRIFSPGNWKYYNELINNEFDVFLGRDKRGTARLLAVEAWLFRDIPKTLKIIDTGTEDYERIFQKFGISDSSMTILLSFRRVK